MIRFITITVSAVLLLTCTVCTADYMSDLKDCSDLKDAKKRLACYDVAVPVAIKVDASVKENQRKTQDEAVARTQRETFERQILADKQPVLDVFSALGKMAGRVQAGVSYKDYSQPLGDLTFSVNSYLETPAAKKYPAVTSAVVSALVSYKDAGTFWQLRFILPEARNGFVPASQALVVQLARQYDLPYTSGHGYFIDEALAKIWSKSGQFSADAQNAFKPQ